MTSLLSRAIAPPANGHGRRNFPCLHKDERRLRPTLGKGATKLRADGRIARMTRVDRSIAGLIAVPLLFGRGACRERVGKYGSGSVGGGALINKKLTRLV